MKPNRHGSQPLTKDRIIPWLPLLLMTIAAAGFIVFIMPQLVQGRGSDIDQPWDTLTEYCTSADYGVEGVLPESNKRAPTVTLKHVVLNIRHGDRSPLFSIPNMIPVDGSVTKGLSSNNIAPYVPGLTSFTLQPLEDYEHVFLDPLNITLLDLNAQRHIAPGQLTPHGFEQHIKLGRHLKLAYKPLFEHITSPEQIFVRSTNFERTFQVRAVMFMTCISFYLIIYFEYSLLAHC
jgi:hypothetical protein